MVTKSLEDLTVSVVIPNFNGKKLLSENLPFVVGAANFEANKIKEIIIIDDASFDKSIGFIKTEYPEIKIVRHKINRGFSASVNTGVRSSKGELVCLLNTDVQPEKDFLVAVLPHFADPSVFGISLHEKGYGGARGIFRDGFVMHQPKKEGEKASNTFWISGGSGVFRRNYWIKLGGMDEKLFSPFYWEDVDLSYRALKRRYRLLWEPDARVLHKHEGSMGIIPSNYRKRIQERNQLLFIWKNLSSRRLLRKHLVGLLRRMVKHPGYIKVFFLAFLKLRKILVARKKLRKEEKVSDEAIFASFN